MRAKKSCFACSADDRGRRGAGVGLYASAGDVEPSDVTGAGAAADDVTGNLRGEGSGL